MKIYLVGGAVRDELLGRPVAERDWVVVGGTPEQLLARGFRQVGRDFPVFLHPRTGEQYALARTERSTGTGHVDFVCDASPEVTLGEDLARRDLTINAMARDGDELIDPHGGRADLAARLLRHVSPAFAEDPLRVFRVARFAAQLPGFQVADQTLALMASMTPALAALSGERVWREFERAAGAPRPERFFEVLAALDGARWFTALDLPATIELYRQRSFKTARVAVVATGWVNNPRTTAEVYEALRAPRLARRAALALATHGATLAGEGTRPEALLEALTAIGGFRQGPLTALVLDAAEDCAGVSLTGRRQLIEELRGLAVDAAPGPGYGAALRRRRIAHLEARHPEARR